MELRIRPVYPLLLAYANNYSPIMGRTRFQKMIFLLQTKHGDKDPEHDLGFNFIPYDYGPYSKALQMDINGLIEDRLLEEKPTKNDSGKYMYRYEITNAGKMLVDHLLTEPKYDQHQFKAMYKILQEIKSNVNEKDMYLLLWDIYTSHPEYAQFSKYKF